MDTTEGSTRHQPYVEIESSLPPAFHLSLASRSSILCRISFLKTFLRLSSVSCLVGQHLFICLVVFPNLTFYVSYVNNMRGFHCDNSTQCPLNKLIPSFIFPFPPFQRAFGGFHYQHLFLTSSPLLYGHLTLYNLEDHNPLSQLKFAT
jgi:hypothetical protein